MTTQELAELLTELLGDSEVALPVPLQALIAGTVLSASGAPVSKAGMARVARYSHGSAHKHYNRLLEVLQKRIPLEVSRMSEDERDPITTTQLRADVTERDAAIGELRRQLRAQSEVQENVRRYALALHQRVVDLEAELASLDGRKVRPLRILE